MEAPRIHAVILTRNRPETLERCVNTALSALAEDDVLTVVDDSTTRMSHVNATILARAPRGQNAHLIHVRAKHLHDVIAEATGERRALWQSKTAPRDIAPIRNLTLLISASLQGQTTILIDDDICSFDLETTHFMLEANQPLSKALILGAEIGGTTEQDTVTRLSHAMHLLRSKSQSCPVSSSDLFRVARDFDGHCAHMCEWLSAGYMAFRLPSTALFAFPPGYNEDWLWCLLHGVLRETRLLQADQLVLHEPPVLRHSTRDDIHFEISGDLIFDCLMECRDVSPRTPAAVLEYLGNHAPDPSVMPSLRAEGVLKQAYGLSENGYSGTVAELENYGLSVLRDMLHSGELDLDGSRMLRAWSIDATAKHKSFALTLGTVTVRSAIQATLEEGSI